MCGLGCVGRLVRLLYDRARYGCSLWLLYRSAALLCILSFAGRILKFNYATVGFSGRRGRYAVQVRQDVAKPSDTDC